MPMIDWRNDDASTRFRQALANRKVVALLAGIVALYAIITVAWTFSASAPPAKKSGSLYGENGKVVDNGGRHRFLDGTVYQRPGGTKVMGLVFYGRWDRVQILDCYLKKNLVKNGGFLDGIIFIVNTEVKSDLDKLQPILDSEPDFYKKGVQVKHKDNKMDFHDVWANLANDDTIYIKMDDDIVYIHPDAVPRMVQYRLENPDPYLISANVINNPMPSWIHYHLGTQHGFLPEPVAPRGFGAKNKVADWRVSKLPKAVHSGDPDKDYEDPKHEHRWLPLPDHDSNTDFTPIHRTEYSSGGKGWEDWRIAAQEHMSLLKNIEIGDKALRKYFFKEWDSMYWRLSINMIAIYGRDLHAALPMPSDDEQHLTVTMPVKLNRHNKFVGEALAAHYSFYIQKKGLAQTDILERYRALARETCGSVLLDN